MATKRRTTAGGKAAASGESRTVAAKTAAAPATAMEPEAEVEAPDPAETAAGSGPVLRKKDLVARVVAASGAKKKLARDVVEATLEELGAALSRGEALNLPPFGKVRVNRTREAGGGEVLVLRLRRGGAKGANGEEAHEGLAEAGEGV